MTKTSHSFVFFLSFQFITDRLSFPSQCWTPHGWCTFQTPRNFFNPRQIDTYTCQTIMNHLSLVKPSCPSRIYGQWSQYNVSLYPDFLRVQFGNYSRVVFTEVDTLITCSTRVSTLSRSSLNKTETKQGQKET